jgi:putative ATP-dependent endonuclease of the OLD family
MKLVTLSVRNYRSIIEAPKLSLGNYAVLVGPNNEGKSNIVKAIALSLGLLTRARAYRRTSRAPVRFYRTGSGFQFDYDWARDFPVSLQPRYPAGRSEFVLEFQLTDDDFKSFRKLVQVNLSSNLQVKLGFGPEDVSLEILMKGPGKKNLNDKKEEIADFIRAHISAQYISALRPSEMALEIVDALIRGELNVLEDNPDYRKLIKQIQDLHQPILDKIAATLKDTVSDFVPRVKNIQIANEQLGRSFRTSFRIMVDDGANTELASKGDGIISLTTISLMKYVSEESLGGKSLILSIEEPESHLHPAAIHGLRHVLKDISKEHQVIVSTHSPILVEREDITQNILVRGGRAERARRIEQIRDSLGIQMADNLVGAHLVLLVEGEEDKDLVALWLAALSPQLKNGILNRLLAIDHLAGATNLGYKATFYGQNVFGIHAFMDNDEEGRKAVQDALIRNVLEPSDYTLATCQGMRDSEIEDLLLFDAYSKAVQEKFGVSLDHAKFHTRREKWTERVQEVFQLSGKLWNRSIRMQVKRTVVDACMGYGLESLNANRRSPISALASVLESKLLSHTLRPK